MKIPNHSGFFFDANCKNILYLKNLKTNERNAVFNPTD